MKFISHGLIFKKKHFPKWNKTHAWVPTPIMISKNICKVFYAGRDKNNLSSIGSFDVNLNNPTKILNIAQSPLLELGPLGYFDDCAVLPSQIFIHKKKFYLFYIGWTQGAKVPYMAALGLACSNSLNKKFKRISLAPIIGRSNIDPIFTASCFVQKYKKKFKTFYTSNLKWSNINNVLVPKYIIKEGFSKNLLDWKYKKIAINHKNKNEIALTRPWLLKDKNKKSVMIYSYGQMKNKKNNYEIGMAYNKNGNWIRRDKDIQILNYKDKFDDKTQEYGATVFYKGKNYIFYNGNNFGEKGIGLGIEE
tara:strand:+ start:1501 stop:2418 length:918 start_codon:yes stop_codon:yes gene_type:complete